MEFSVPREVRDLERRVGLTPAIAQALIQAGHVVYVERDAGQGAGFSDADYSAAGAQIVYSPTEAYRRGDVVVKVARPTAVEHALFRPGQITFSFLHLPVASPDLLQALEQKQLTSVAYEMIEEDDGHRPVARATSEIAGRMAPILAGQFLQISPVGNGLGILPSGIPGVPPAAVVIVGGGVLGLNAAVAFAGLGAEVTVLDNDTRQLQRIDERFGGRVTTMFANGFNLARATQFADVLVGAAHVPGQRAPVLVTRAMVQRMRAGSVIIDFAIDEGGCIATSRPMTLRDPVYVADNVIHHCVPNITAVYARTTSYALANAALPYLLAIAEKGINGAIKSEPALRRGINVYQGKLAHASLAVELGQASVLNPAERAQT